MTTKNLNELRDECHAIARAKGWHGEQCGAVVFPPNDREGRFPELLALVHSEVSEALEAYREGKPIAEFRVTMAGTQAGIPSELADILIRVLDICGLYGVDIGRAVQEKMAFNKTRPFRHGGKRC